MPRLSRSTSSRPLAGAPRSRLGRRSWAWRFAAEPPRGLGVALSLIFLGSSAFYGAQLGGEWPRVVATYGAPGDMVANLLGMRVELPTEELVGTVEELYELPQGLALDVRRAEPRASETVLVLYDDNTIASVDKEKRVIVITPPEGLLE